MLEPIRARRAARPALAILLLPMLCGARATAEVPSRSTLTGHDARAVIVSESGSGVVSVVRGATIELPAGADAAEAVRGWLAEHAHEFGLEPGRDELRAAALAPLMGPVGLGTRVRLKQYHDGLEVEGGDALAVLDASGRLRFIASGLVPGLDVTEPARVTREQAEAIAALARPAPGSLASLVPHASVLVVTRGEHGDRLTWRVTTVLADGRPAVTRVDAVTGEVLEADAGIAHAVGRVWPTDPRQPTEELELFGLLPGSGMASAAFAIKDQVDPPALPVAPDDYRFLPGDPSFDQVNTYWHVQHYFRDFMAGLGYAGPPQPLTIAIHAPVQPQVAFTSGTFVYFGQPIPSLCNEACRSHDIVYHELGHTVLYGFGIQPGGAHREAGAMHEALADYFAAAITGDPAIGEWEYLTFPAGVTRVDQPAPPWDFAHYDQVAYNGGAASTVWGNSMILSSGLWDLRRSIGAASDSLVLESLALLPSVPTWAQFANALLEADLERHGERYSANIVAALLSRQIRGTAVVGITGPNELEPKVVGTFTAAPCCGSLVGSYHWRVRSWQRGVPIGDWRDVGDGPTLNLALVEDSELSLTVTSPWGDVLSTSRFVGVRLPQLTILGPDRIVQHTPGTWSAQVVAVGPATVNWKRQWRRPGFGPDPLGDGNQRSFVADTSFDLTVTLTDGLGRSAVERFAVQTYLDHPPPASSAPLVVRVTVAPGAREVETAFALRNASALRAVVYDVRGRVRMPVWDGPASAGEHVIRWDDSELEPGIYFLRVEAGTHGHVVRFVVVR